MQLDFIVFQYINNLAGRHLWLDTLAIFFAEYFGYILVLLLFSFLFWPSKTKKAEWSDFLFENLKKYWLMIVQAFLAGILARFIIVNIIRYFLPRQRPFAFLNFAQQNLGGSVENHVNLLVDKVNQSAFPSGHAAFFFAIATIVYFYNKKAGLLFFIASFLISISRVFTGIHWPSDIIAGAIIGILSSFLFILFFRKPSLIAKK